MNAAGRSLGQRDVGRWGTAVRGWTALLVVALIATACSGRGSDDDSADDTVRTDSDLAELFPGTQDVDEPDDEASGERPVARGSGGGSPEPGDAQSGPAAAPDPAPETGGQEGGPGGGASAGGFTWQPANLWPANEDKKGMSDNELVICQVGPWTVSAATGFEEEDAKTFWKWINDNGGIHGRTVRFITADTAYNPQGAVQAAEQCSQHNPYMLIILDTDGTPAVRDWSEKNRMLFFPMLAPETGINDFKYSFTVVPTHVQTGRVNGRYAAAHFPRAKYGVVWRDSPMFKEYADGFLAELGKKPEVRAATRPNQSDYTTLILELSRKQVEIVGTSVNPIEFTQLVKQASAQGYRPRWFILGGVNDFIMNVLGDEVDGSKGPPAVGSAHVTSKIRPGKPDGDEQRTMMAAYAKYRPGKTYDSTDWLFWTYYRRIAQMMMDCGRDCGRNMLAGMMLAGYQQNLNLPCTLDFSRGQGKFGVFASRMWMGGQVGGQSEWLEVEPCKEQF